MEEPRTSALLAAMTDEGKFEELAMAILREAVPEYERAVHIGMNAAGKTVKAPVDGMLFIPGSTLHVVAFHHTTTGKDGLDAKWLRDPATVKRRKANSPPPSAGDFVKTREIVQKERLQTPGLKATLVLTTNEDPSDDVILKIEREANAAGIEIDLWSRSRLSHFLDYRPIGHYLRAKFLGVEQELLSLELMKELCRRSLAEASPPDEPEAWVSRGLDTEIASALERTITFVAGPSGTGKTVACYRRLFRELESGGLALVLTADVVATATTLDQAVTDALLRLHPTLSSSGPSPFSYCTEDRPLLLLVEDINKFGSTHQLIERIASWAESSKSSSNNDRQSWRLVCPVWPGYLSTLQPEQQKRVYRLSTAAGAQGRREAYAQWYSGAA